MNTNIYVENPFSLKGKTMGQTLNNFTIIKSITIILMYASWLKKKNLCYFSLLSHTQIIFLKGDNPFSFLFHYAAPTFFFTVWYTSFLLFTISLYICETHVPSSVVTPRATQGVPRKTLT